MKIDNPKKKDLYKTIIVKELARTYKYPDAAYQALDFQGKGYINAQDFAEGKFIYKLPFQKDELLDFLQNETIFKKIPQIRMEVFTKNFFPSKLKEGGGRQNYDFSDSDDSDEKNISPLQRKLGTSSLNDFTIGDNSSVLSTSKNRDITNKIKQIEELIKERLSNNWVSVRKSFLDLDEDFDGFITAEDFAKIIGGSSGSSKFDFNLLKMLIKMRTGQNNHQTKVNYTDFCKWFGAAIEPVEAFYFRHDSMKNPQYEKNIQKTVQQYAGGQKKIREILSNQNLKTRFIEKLRSQYKTLQRAFTDMNKSKTGFISYEEFDELIRQWGFDANDELIREIFQWLDSDKDNKISYEDLRSTAGLEVRPMEQLFFRQDVKPGKPVSCKYEKCWENNNFNSKSQYCPLHQKIMRNLSLDKFSQIALAANEDQWHQILVSVSNSNFQMTIMELSRMLKQVLGYELKFKEKEFIWETFKLKPYLEDNPDNIDERIVTLQALINAKKQTRLKKVNQLINMEADEEQYAEDIKLKGLQQVGEDYILQMAINKKARWGGIWRSIKTIDKDSNGYVTIDELEEIFREQFPLELDKRSLYHYFKKFASIQNKNLINYKMIKDHINNMIMKDSIQEHQLRIQTKEEISPAPLTERQAQMQRRKLNTDINLSSDDEQNLKIEGQSQAPQELSTLNGFGGYQKAKYQPLMKIDSKRIMKDSKSITPLKQSLLDRKKSTQVTALPSMNRNTSIQKLNNLYDIETSETLQNVELSQILNNKSTTSVMNKAYQKEATFGTRNKSMVKLGGALSQLSVASTAKSLKFNEDVKIKLAYEWKNVYRSLVQADTERKGTIPISTFNKIIHQHKVYLSREELRKIEQLYTASSTNPLVSEIDYVKISQELGLHKQSLDFIKPKTKQFLDQMTKIRDTPSRGSLISLSKSQFGGGFGADYPLTERIVGGSGQADQSKLKTVLEFMQNQDKQKTGQIPIANFVKILRIFGVQLNPGQIKANEVGMVEFEKVLESVSAQ